MFEESQSRTVKTTEDFCRPFHGLNAIIASGPSSELLGYFQSSASRTLLAELPKVLQIGSESL